MLDTKTIDGLSPGVRDLVVLLNANGFETCDSGDGSNHAAGMEGAFEGPMVAISTSPERMVYDAHRLLRFLHGLIEGPKIEASYDPADEIAIILLTWELTKDIDDKKETT